MDRRAFLRGGVLVAVVALAGCSGGEGTPTGGTATSTASPTETSPSTDGAGGDTTGTATDDATAGDEPTGSSPTEPSDATDMPTTDSATQTDTPTETPTATGSPTATPSPDQEVLVGPNGTLTFQPQSFTISMGDTVLWRWESGGHNVSPTEGEQPSGADWPGKDESTYPAGTTYTYTFDVAGDYDYHCDPHRSAGMVGSFTVE